MIGVRHRALRFFRDDDLLKHASIMFIASIIAGVCNYIYQLYMGRALGPEEYGIFGSLFAIFYIISVLTTTIQASGFYAGITKENVFSGNCYVFVFCFD
jgi:O-antigen/teichoic acid export membrane protein